MQLSRFLLASFLAAANTTDIASAKVEAQAAFAAVEAGGGLAVVGRTNLPRGTKLMVGLRKGDADVASDRATVGEFGQFYAGPFTSGSHTLPDGEYTIDITGELDAEQPTSIKALIGPNWSNYGGQNVPKSNWGTVPEFLFTFRYEHQGGKFMAGWTTPATASIPRPNLAWGRHGISARVSAHAKQDPANREAAYYMCMEYIRQNLRDPDSADFLSDYAPALVNEVSDNVFIAMLRVRAANGFGGKTVSIFRCETELDGEEWKGLGLKEISD